MNPWQRLQPREQRLLLIAAVTTALLLLYVAVIEPMQQQRQSLTQAISQQQQELQWLVDRAAEVAQLRGSQPAPSVANRSESLMALVDRRAREKGIDKSIRRIQPEGQRAVQVWLEQAPFNSLLEWIESMAGDGIEVTGLLIERQPTAGWVNARLTLEGGE
jgi:general secretion pathway protein M